MSETHLILRSIDDYNSLKSSRLPISESEIDNSYIYSYLSTVRDFEDESIETRVRANVSTHPSGQLAVKLFFLDQDFIPSFDVDCTSVDNFITPPNGWGFIVGSQKKDAYVIRTGFLVPNQDSLSLPEDFEKIELNLPELIAA